MPSFGDQRIDELVDSFSEYAEELASIMADMPEAEGQKRLALYALIAMRLEELRKEAYEWAEETVADIYTEADRRVMDELEEVGLLEYAEVGDRQDEDVKRLVLMFTSDIDQALNSIRDTAVRMKSGYFDYRLFGILDRRKLAGFGLAGMVAVMAKNRMRKQIRDGLVRILTNNGKIYGYSLDYYIGLVADVIKQRAISAATIMRMMLNGQDLVMISPNPSTIGDYCDEYRGKIFSLSGTNPRYPSIRLCPGGGPPPFHPHCHHYPIPVFSQEMMEEGESVDNEFLELGAVAGATPNDFQKLWLSKKR